MLYPLSYGEVGGGEPPRPQTATASAATSTRCTSEVKR